MAGHFEPPEAWECGHGVDVEQCSVCRQDAHDIVELALCEQNALILRPGMLYRFAVHDCDKCKQLEVDGRVP